MYKIFYHHCNKCLCPSLWNIALKDIKNILLIKWHEWKKSQNKVQYFTVHTILFIEFCQLFHQGPRGSDNKFHIIGSACHISWLHKQGQHWVVWYWLLCLVIVSASWQLQISFMHMLGTYSKNKKEQQYLFLFNNFLNKILKHLTYIWYYTMGLCN